MTALIALLALSTYAPATSPVEADAISLFAEPVALAPLQASSTSKSRLSYTFIEANYLWVDFDELEDELDGWEARGSFEIPLNIFLQAAYSQLSGDADVDSWRFGAGWHLPIGQKLDVYGILSATGTDIEDENEDGIAAEAGARFLLGDKFEINGRGTWVDLEDSEAGLGVGGRFYFTPSMSAGLNADFNEDTTSYAAGLRFQF